jgi:hypothetical protein
MEIACQARLPVILLVVGLGEETLSLEPLNTLGLACVLVLKNVSVEPRTYGKFADCVVVVACIMSVWKYISTTLHSGVVTCWRSSQP